MLALFLNAIGNLLCSKQCQHNVKEPSYCTAAKMVRVLSSVHAICSTMTSAITCILHINSDDKWLRQWTGEALPEGVSWDIGSNRNESNVSVSCIQ